MGKIGRTVIKIIVVVVVLSVLSNVSGQWYQMYFAPEAFVNIQGDQWKYVTVKEARCGDNIYPRYGVVDEYPFTYCFKINTPLNTEAYLEKRFDIPRGTSSFYLAASHPNTKIILFDSHNVEHVLGRVPYYQYNQYQNRYNQYQKEGKNEFDTSSYAGQSVRIRIHQIGPGWGSYRDMMIITQSKSQSKSSDPVTTVFHWIFRIMFILLLIIVVLYLLRARHDGL